MNITEQQLHFVKIHSAKGNELYQECHYEQAIQEFEKALTYADREEDRTILQANIEDLNKIMEQTLKVDSMWKKVLFDFLFFFATIALLAITGLIIYYIKH